MLDLRVKDERRSRGRGLDGRILASSGRAGTQNDTLICRATPNSSRTLTYILTFVSSLFTLCKGYYYSHLINEEAETIGKLSTMSKETRSKDRAVLVSQL